MLGIDRVLLAGRIEDVSVYAFADDPRETNASPDKGESPLVTQNAYRTAAGEFKRVDQWHTVHVYGRAQINHLAAAQAAAGDVASLSGHIEYAEYQDAAGAKRRKAVIVVTSSDSLEITISKPAPSAKAPPPGEPPAQL